MLKANTRSMHPGWRVALVALAVLILAGCAGTAEHARSSGGELNQRQFTLKHIDTVKARDFLARLDLGTVFSLAGHDLIVVRGTAEQLHRASLVMELVDTEGEYFVQKLTGATKGRSLPGSADSGRLSGDVVIGTFADPPVPGDRAGAIVDVHQNHIVVIAPVRVRHEILALVEPDPDGTGQVRIETSTRSDTMEPSASEHMASSQPILSGPARPRPRARLVAMPNRSDPVAQTPSQREPVRPPEAKIVPADGGPPISSQVTVGSTDGKKREPLALIGGDEVLQLDLPQQLDLIQLLDLVGEYLELDYMYDPGKLNGQIVTLKLHGKLRGRMKVRELYSLLESVLKFKGFAMTCHEGNLVTIVPAAEALQINPDLIDSDEGSIDAGDMVVTSVFDLQSIETAAASTLLQNMKLSLAVTPVEGSRSLIVTCYAHQVDQIERLLSVVDRPGRPREFRFRQLKHTTAKSLARKVKELTGALGSVFVTFAAGTGEAPATAPDRPRPFGGSNARSAPGPQGAGLDASGDVYLDADERTNRIMMIGHREQLALVEGLIDTLDVAQQDLRVLKVYDIRHVEAEEVARKLQELEIVGPGEQGGGRAAGGKIATAEIVDGTVAESAQLVVLEATNSIAINATEQQHGRIEAMMDHLDVEVRKEAVPYEIYFLENQDPEDLALVLEKIVHETFQGKEGKVQKRLRQVDDQIMIVPDKQTFSLIVYASRKNQDWVSKLISTLDRRRPQVLIDVTLVEIRKTEEFNYDLNLITSIPDLVETGGQTGSFLVDGKTVVEKLLEPGMRGQFADFQIHGGAGTGFYADRQVNVLLTAMQAKNYGRILAKPKVLVNDNEKGQIKTTETTYVIKTSSVPVTSGTAGQQSNLIETAVDYEGYDAGITLEIMPHISAGDLLRLEVTLIRSDFGTITGERPPDQTSSDISTVVTVPDRSTIILGGMLKLNQSKSGNKVPVLGDLPLVGGAFRSISNSDIQSRLYVFVRAEVIRPSETHAGSHEELVRISEQNRNAFETHEAEFQNHQNWPGAKPKPVDPAKVLEAQ